MKRLLFFIAFSLCAIFAQAQFRLAVNGTPSWSNLGGGLYQATVTFHSDLTGNSFAVAGIADTMRLFASRGQVFEVDTVWGKTFSQATMRVSYLEGVNSAPVGQGMVYDPAGSVFLPDTPFGSTGATAQLNQAVVSYNASKSIRPPFDSTDITTGGVGNTDLAAGIVTTGKIADDAVTLAKQAAGTANRLIGYDGSGNPSEISAGSNVTISGGSISTPSVIVADSLDDLPAATAFKAADRVVLTDSTGTYFKLVRQTKDSIAAKSLKEGYGKFILTDKYQFTPEIGSKVVDTITVIPVSDTSYSENLLKRSGDLEHFPFWNNSSNSTTLSGVITTAPDGTYRASRVKRNAGNQFAYVPSTGGGGGTAFNLFETNTTYTLSLWAKTNTSSWIYPTISNTDLAIDTFNVTNSWERYSWTFTSNGSISPTGQITFRIGLDSLDIFNVQLQRGSHVGTDIVTPLDSQNKRENMYAVIVPQAGYYEYSSFKLSNPKKSASQILNAMLTNCALDPECEGVLIDENIIIQNTVTVPENVAIKSIKGVTVTLDLKNASSDGFVLGTLTATYNQGITADGLNINAISAGRSAIRVPISLYLTTSNIKITGNDLLTYGIYEPKGTFRNIGRRVENVTISSCQSGYYTTMQKTSNLTNVSISGGTTGIDCRGCGFSAYNVQLEGIDGRGINAISATNIDIIKLRIEDVPNTQDVDETFFISKADRVTFTSCELGPVHSFDEATDVVIKLDTVIFAKVDACNMESMGFATPVSTTENTNALVWDNNILDAKQIDLTQINDETLLYYINDQDGETTIPKQFLYKSDALITTMDSTFINGRIDFLSDTVSLVGPNNLLRRSQSITHFPYWNNNSGSVSLATGEVDPDGGTTASKIKPIGGIYAFSFLSVSGSSPYTMFEKNMWYNLSFYAKTYNVADTSFIVPIISNTIDFSADTAHVVNSWTRYNFSFKTTDLIPVDVIRFDIGQTDSIAFAFPQLSKGKYLKDYQPTSSTDEIIATKVVFTGDMQLNESLIDSSGSPGTAGQVPISTVTGWHWGSTSTALDANYFKQGGNSFGASATLGTNDANSLNFETNNTRRLTIPSSGIANTPSSTKALVLSPDDSLGYTTLQSSDFTATVTQSGSDTLQNSATCYGHFTRVGNIVTFTVRVEIALTNTGNANTVYFSPPVASNFTTAASDVIGTANLDTQGLSSSNIPHQRALLFASDTDDKIGISFDPVASLSYPENRMYISVSGSYIIQ